MAPQVAGVSPACFMFTVLRKMTDPVPTPLLSGTSFLMLSSLGDVVNSDVSVGVVFFSFLSVSGTMF